MLTSQYRAFLEELFSGLGSLDIRPMFGVSGLFCNGTMFAVVAHDIIFLKTDEASRGDFLRAGTGPFVYRIRDDSEIVTSYYELPQRLLDEPDQAVLWARRAWEIALGSPTALRKERKRAKPRTPRQPARRRKRS